MRLHSVEDVTDSPWGTVLLKVLCFGDVSSFRLSEGALCLYFSGRPADPGTKKVLHTQELL